MTTADLAVTYFLAIYLIAYPVFVAFYIAFGVNRASPKVAERFESLFDSVKQEKGRTPLINIALFLARRAIIAVILMTMTEYPFWQLLIMITFSLIILVYQLSVRPFEKSDDAFFEFFNEAVLLLISYILLALLLVSHQL